MHHTILIISRMIFSIIKIYINYINAVKFNSNDFFINLRLDLKKNNFIKLKNYFYNKYKYNINRKDLFKKKKKYI